MRLRSGRDEDWKQLLDDLETLQRAWEGRLADRAKLGGAHLHGVVFGIEMGRRSIGERDASSLNQLNALLDDWESIGKFKVTGPAAESIAGIDFGISLVVRRIRRYLNRQAQPKPPKPVEASPRYGRKPRSQT